MTRGILDSSILTNLSSSLRWIRGVNTDRVYAWRVLWTTRKLEKTRTAISRRLVKGIVSGSASRKRTLRFKIYLQSESSIIPKRCDDLIEITMFSMLSIRQRWTSLLIERIDVRDSRRVWSSILDLSISGHRSTRRCVGSIVCTA